MRLPPLIKSGLWASAGMFWAGMAIAACDPASDKGCIAVEQPAQVYPPSTGAPLRSSDSFQHQYRHMPPGEKEAFEETRRELREDFNEMEQQEREEFRRHLKSTNAHKRRTHYIEKPEARQQLPLEERPWGSLTYEEKRQRMAPKPETPPRP